MGKRVDVQKLANDFRDILSNSSLSAEEKKRQLENLTASDAYKAQARAFDNIAKFYAKVGDRRKQSKIKGQHFNTAHFNNLESIERDLDEFLAWCLATYQIPVPKMLASWLGVSSATLNKYRSEDNDVSDALNEMFDIMESIGVQQLAASEKNASGLIHILSSCFGLNSKNQVDVNVTPTITGSRTTDILQIAETIPIVTKGEPHDDAKDGADHQSDDLK